MKVLICGAGKVGTTIAKYLSEEKHQVVLIDENKEKLDDLSSKLDIQTVEGSLVNPLILEQAGAKGADMIICVTHNTRHRYGKIRNNLLKISQFNPCQRCFRQTF